MNEAIKSWFELPKSIKLLDISIIGFILVSLISFTLYLAILDHTIQNLMIVFLGLIISLFTWFFRPNLMKATNEMSKKRYFRDWVTISSIFIIVVLILVIAYPVTYL